MSNAARTSAFGRPIGFETFAATTATALTPTAGAKSAIVTVDGDAVRWRTDGVSPTTSVGMYIGDGGAFEVAPSELPTIEFIAVSGTGNVSVTYYA